MGNHCFAKKKTAKCGLGNGEQVVGCLEAGKCSMHSEEDEGQAEVTGTTSSWGEKMGDKKESNGGGGTCPAVRWANAPRVPIVMGTDIGQRWAPGSGGSKGDLPPEGRAVLQQTFF